MTTAFLEIERNGLAFEIEVSGDYHSATRGYCDCYGVPEEPDEPAYVDEITGKALIDIIDEETKQVVFPAGTVFELSEEEERKAEEAIAEKIEDSYYIEDSY